MLLAQSGLEQSSAEIPQAVPMFSALHSMFQVHL